MKTANDFDEEMLGSLGFDCEAKRERVIHCSDVHKSFNVISILDNALGKEIVIFLVPKLMVRRMKSFYLLI